MGRNNKGKNGFCDVWEPERGQDFWKRKRKERINQPPSKLNVDVHGILFAVVAVVFVRTWAATAGAGYLPLQYDELRRDPVGVVSRIYAFLGVEAHATRPDLYARSMRKPLSEYVENLDEVREALRGTPWAADPVLT